MSSFCEVYLIRHGQTQWNVEGKLQGHTDEPLNQEGEKQALALKEKFAEINFTAAFSSDLLRASKTASIALGSKKLETVRTAALRERYMGSWEGRLTKDLKKWFADNGISADNFSKEEYLSFKWQNDIESYSEVYKRLTHFIKEQVVSRLGSTILLSSHGGVLRALLYHLDFQPRLRWQVSNCAYVKLLVDKTGALSIVEFQGAKLVEGANVPF